MIEISDHLDFTLTFSLRESLDEYGLTDVEAPKAVRDGFAYKRQPHDQVMALIRKSTTYYRSAKGAP